MKRSIIIGCLFLISSSLLAQSNTEEIDLVQSVFGMEKKAVVKEFIQLEGAKSDAFWKLYDEFEVKRKELGKKRISLLNKYAETYLDMTDQNTEEMLKEMMSLQTGNDKLIGSYADKIKKAVDVKTAAQFYQIEGYILSKIRAEILENIPLIGSLDDN
jgi:hypothetical protein